MENEEKQISFTINSNIHTAFKAATAARGVSMKTALEYGIDAYIMNVRRHNTDTIYSLVERQLTGDGIDYSNTWSIYVEQPIKEWSQYKILPAHSDPPEEFGFWTTNEGFVDTVERVLDGEGAEIVKDLPQPVAVYVGFIIDALHSII